MIRRTLLVSLACASVLWSQDTRAVGTSAAGAVILPTHQMLRPAGHQVDVPGRPTDLITLHEGELLAIKGMKDLVLLSTQDRIIRQSLRVPRDGLSYHGLAASKDESLVFVTGTRDILWVAQLRDGVASWDRPIHLPGPRGRGPSAPGGILVQDENRLLVTLSRNNSLGVVDLRTWSLVREIPVGVAPYDVMAWKDLVCVTNWGGRHPREGDSTDTSSGTPVVVDPTTNVAASGTVSLIDLKAGKQVAEIDVGLHPCAMAVDRERGLLYVANANSDSVSVVDLSGRAVTRTFSTRPLKDLPFGSSPNALALSEKGDRLYVANGTNNAVAVFAVLEGDRLLGQLPTGWYPGGLALDEARGWLHVANTKGWGSRHPPTGKRGLNSHDHLGSISLVTDLSAAALKTGAATVHETNRHMELKARLRSPDPHASPVPVPARHGEPSVFQHVLYIIKENRTYDQVLGDQPQGNGDPGLCVFGRDITPNHHAITDEFVLLDNFYCSGVLSADGHQWTDEAFVTDYLEKMFGGFVRSYPYDGDDPLAYASSGFLWDNVLRHGRTFRSYGEMVHAHIEPRGSFSQILEDFRKGTGRFKIRGTAHIDAISANMCPTYIGFPSVVPDVYRAAEFIKELKGFERSGRLPALMMLLLPNDHTSGTRPGRPTPAASVADNDLALGQIIEAMSHSRFWPRTCIFVVQDDPQNGWDHVDGHRTVAMVASPYTRRKAVVSERYTQPSMVKTIELILGLPPMNQMDLFAEPMTACFTEKADLTPYVCRPNKVPLDQLNVALNELEGPARRDALASLALDLDEVDKADEDTLNRILWHAMKGHRVPYPETFTNAGRIR